MVKIIIDSTCDLPEELIKKYDIKVLPLSIHLNNNEYLDKVTITVEEVYEAMKKDIHPKTSQPSPMHIYKVFEEYASEGQDFIYLSFSSKLSGTFQTAYSICEEIKEKYPKVNMKVIDSKGGSTATGLIVLQILELVKISEDFNEIVNYSEELIESIEHIFTISDLKWLIKGGRINRSSAIIGSVLNIKPIVHVNDGVIEFLQKVRGKKKALNTIVDILEERINKSINQIIGISHADDIETALELEKMINNRLGIKNIVINKIGSVLGSHLGIGGVGVFFFNQKLNNYYI